MLSSRSKYLTVLVCDCGCRVADPDPARAYRLMAKHETTAGCGSRAAHRTADRRAQVARG